MNDPNCDGDGLLDGWESSDGDAEWDGSGMGTGASVTTGETHLCMADTDGDGLLDGKEEGLFGHGAVSVHSPLGTDTIARLDSDSDHDYLTDYEEVNVYNTDPLNCDSDGDDVADSVEIATWDAAIAARLQAGYDAVEFTSSTPHLGYFALNQGRGASRDSRNHADPNADDTDGDGITDDLEIAYGCNCGAGTDGYVNDDDWDDDGLQGGREYELFGTGADVAAANSNDGELNDDAICCLCDPDPDGDGDNLLDGEGDQMGTDALDWDSDDDGLSDFEELETYFTGPNDDDTDDDKAEGNIAAREPTIAPVLAGHSGDGTIITLSDCEEAFSGSGYPPVGNPLDETDPLQVDTDGDGLTDAIEFKVGCSCTTTDWCDCPTNPAGWTYADPNAYGVVYDPIRDGYANSSDSDEDGLRDGEDIHEDLVASAIDFPGKVFTRRAMYIYPGEVKLREQRDDGIHSICDPDSDGDGLLDGEEFAIGTDWLDWDTDDDGRNDWHEHTGGEQATNTDPIPTDPLEPDTDDDGLLDSAEVFGLNNTNPLNADTDGDGLCDGGAGTPYLMDCFNGDTTVHVNPICKSCSTPGLGDCGATGGIRTGSVDGIGDHPNPHGYGEDKSGNGAWDGGLGEGWGSGDSGMPETDPNQYDTDGDGEGDGVEVLGFSTSRQHMIPPADIFGREVTVEYPACGCLEPLILDTDGDGLSDGYEDRNHDGNFDFLPSEFDHQDPLPGPPIPYPTETNPCDPDTDHDGLTDWEERFQRQPLEYHPPLPVDDDGDGLIDEDPIDGIDNDGDSLVDEDPPEGPIELTFNPTNPLDHDTDNDRLLDSEEAYWVCVKRSHTNLDNDGDSLVDEDPVDGLDNDMDGLIDEDGPDFTIRFVPMLDPTNRDSDSDGFIDGLDDDPCNSFLIPILQPVQTLPVDSDGDGFSDLDEELAGTHPSDPEDYPAAACCADLDGDGCPDDAVWLEPVLCCEGPTGIANAVVVDIDHDGLVDLRIAVLVPGGGRQGDFDEDGAPDDVRYTVTYALANYRFVQSRMTVIIEDLDADYIVDSVTVEPR
ncbi:MAG: hypothetical protein ACP5G2_01660 [Candidatus Bipolaricaulaceae bacterium]